MMLCSSGGLVAAAGKRRYYGLDQTADRRSGRGRGVLDLGRYLRLRRLFDTATDTSIIVPMDHGIEESEHRELEDARALIASLADAGANGFLMRRGLARFAASSFAGKAGWVQRLTARTGLSDREAHELLVASVEEAERNGADAVVPTVFFGGETEDSHLPLLGHLADECSKFRMPLMVEVFPTGDATSTPFEGPYTVADMRIAVRTACEEGADLIKTWYTGDPESFSRVVAYSTVPVLVLGGPKGQGNRHVFELAKGAMEAGARGICIGRNIWKAADPPLYLRALAMIVREGKSVEDALVSIEAVGNRRGESG